MQGSPRRRRAARTGPSLPYGRQTSPRRTQGRPTRPSRGPSGVRRLRRRLYGGRPGTRTAAGRLWWARLRCRKGPREAALQRRRPRRQRGRRRCMDGVQRPLAAWAWTRRAAARCSGRRWAAWRPQRLRRRPPGPQGDGCVVVLQAPTLTAPCPNPPMLLAGRKRRLRRRRRGRHLTPAPLEAGPSCAASPCLLDWRPRCLRPAGNRRQRMRQRTAKRRLGPLRPWPLLLPQPALPPLEPPRHHVGCPLLSLLRRRKGSRVRPSVLEQASWEAPQQPQQLQ